MVIHYESDPEDAAVQFVSDEVAVTAEDAATPDTGSIDLTEMNRLAAEITPQVARSGVDLIYQNMISEWLVDPHELAVPEDWKSVWDNGWAAAAEAENKPVAAPIPTTVCRCANPAPGWCPAPRPIPNGRQAGGRQNA